MRPVRNVVSFLIIAAHLGFLGVIFWQRPPTFAVKKRLVVREKRETRVVYKPSPPKKTEPIKPIATVIKKKKVVHKPKPKPKPRPVTKKKAATKPAQPTIPKHLLDKLEESIAKIEKKSDKKRPKTTLSVPKLTRKERKIKKGEDQSYQEKLIALLHRALALLDHGEVVIELTLNSFGGVLRINVIKAQSAKNKEYLRKHLPQVSFPPLEGVDAKKTQKTFRLAFYNEI